MGGGPTDVGFTNMHCAHDGFHTFHSHYNRRDGVLVYFWTCERCDERLDEAWRQEYRPSFDPHGNDAYLTRQAQPAA